MNKSDLKGRRERSMIFVYIRVSSIDQNPERQVVAIKSYAKEVQNENIYIDKESGRDFDREKYQKLKMVFRVGDPLIVKELDRFGRNKQQIKSELNYLTQKGVSPDYSTN